jgi:hypothetical protein
MVMHASKKESPVFMATPFAEAVKRRRHQPPMSLYPHLNATTIEAA